MTVWDVVELVAPYAVPAALAGLAAVLAPALSTARRLRADLTVDTDLLAKLPAGARAELRSDVQRRAHLLVAVTRHPPLTRNEVLEIMGTAAGLTFAYLLARNAPTEADTDPVAYFLMSGLISFAIPFTCWSRFYLSWSLRAHLRLTYIEEHLKESDAEEAALALRVADRVAGLLPAVLQVAVLTYLANGVGVYLGPGREAEWGWTLGGMLVSGALVALTYGLLLVSGQLGGHLISYHPELGGMDAGSAPAVRGVRGWFAARRGPIVDSTQRRP